ncbi:hypothetical protein HZH66_014880 [Vespula vulgaris]|uniref:Uncharacterized protein n=1 Tax=Vespula vulgaris TaxID=7454 RepID=A0A834J054_VESVU|nr:hypothetical protein HZH66_014880 [Vespula vulgaris]
MVPSPPSMSAGVAERKLTTHPYTTRRILRVAATRLSKPGRPNLTPTFFSGITFNQANDGCSTNIYLRVTRLYTLACSMPLLREEIDAHLPRWQRQRWVKMAAVAAPAAAATAEVEAEAEAEAEADHSRRHSILLGRDFDSRRLGGWWADAATSDVEIRDAAVPQGVAVV